MVGTVFDVNQRNWLDPPHNREGFLRVEDLATVVAIPRGNGGVVPLPRSSGYLTNLRVEGPDGLLDLSTWLSATYTDGLLAIRDGEVLVEWYRESMVADDNHLLMSISKSMTSLLCGVLVDQGFLGVTDLVTDHIPELSATAWDHCTVQHLLDMRVGVAWDYDRDELDIFDVSGYRETNRRDLPDSIESWIRSIAASGGHGDTFRYISLVSDVLGWALERSTGVRLEKLLSHHLWSRIGAERDASIIVDANGFRVAEGGVSATLRDVGRLGLMCLRGGRVDGYRVVPGEWLQRLRTPNDDLNRAFSASAEYDSLNPDAFYHDNWWVSNPREGIFSAIGVHGQYLTVHNPSHTVVVKLSSQPSMEDPAMAALDAAGIRAICES